MRDGLITLRLPAADKKILRALARRRGLSLSELAANLIKRAASQEMAAGVPLVESKEEENDG